MPTILPFRAVTFDPARVGSLDAVVTQPYDKINDALQEDYYRRHSCNVIRVTKGKEMEGDSGRENKYTRAARFFRDWLTRGVLRQDAKPAIYVYHQVYALPDGVTRTRKGFTGLVRLEPFGRKIHPHEETHAKPKIDRMNLLRAVRAHTGHIFMLYSDPERRVNGLLDSFTRRPPDLEAKNEFGETHRVWRVTDPEVLRRAAAEMRPLDAYIADGHHRYETALAFRDEMRRKGLRGAGAEGTDGRMATFVNMDEEGLTILATHRLVSGLSGASLSRLLERAADYFEIREFHFTDASEEPAARAALLDALRVEGARRPTVGCCGIGESRYAVLILKDPRIMDEVLDVPRSSAWKQLDVNVLHGICIHRLLGITKEDLSQERYVTYHRHAEDVIRAVREGRGQIGFLLNPVTVEQIKSIVRNGERFPQKTTDFYPKMLSGLLIQRVSLNKGEGRSGGRAGCAPVRRTRPRGAPKRSAAGARRRRPAPRRSGRGRRARR